MKCFSIELFGWVLILKKDQRIKQRTPVVDRRQTEKDVDLWLSKDKQEELLLIKEKNLLRRKNDVRENTLLQS